MYCIIIRIKSVNTSYKVFLIFTKKKIDFISNVICISKYFKCIHSSHSFQNINQSRKVYRFVVRGKTLVVLCICLMYYCQLLSRNEFKCNSMKMPLYYYNMIVVIIMNFITIVDIFHRSYLY